jgi:DnaK suppressor protein
MTPDITQVLADKRQEIQAELAQLQAPADETGGIGFGKRVGDGTSIAVERIAQVDASDRLQEMLADVLRAEAKLADGSYGRCDGCDATIPPDRLEARPWAVRCVACSA